LIREAGTKVFSFLLYFMGIISHPWGYSLLSFVLCLYLHKSNSSPFGRSPFEKGSAVAQALFLYNRAVCINLSPFSKGSTPEGGEGLICKEHSYGENLIKKEPN
jgi:hypothetical protein